MGEVVRDLAVNLSNFDSTSFQIVRQVAVDPRFMYVTLDDYLIGTRAAYNQVKFLVQDKADEEGHSAYSIAGCYFQLVLYVLFRRRGENQDLAATA